MHYAYSAFPYTYATAHGYYHVVNTYSIYSVYTASMRISRPRYIPCMIENLLEDSELHDELCDTYCYIAFTDLLEEVLIKTTQGKNHEESN